MQMARTLHWPMVMLRRMSRLSSRFLPRSSALGSSTGYQHSHRQGVHQCPLLTAIPFHVPGRSRSRQAQHRCRTVTPCLQAKTMCLGARMPMVMCHYRRKMYRQPRCAFYLHTSRLHLRPPLLDQQLNTARKQHHRPSLSRRSPVPRHP